MRLPMEFVELAGEQLHPREIRRRDGCLQQRRDVSVRMSEHEPEQGHRCQKTPTGFMPRCAFSMSGRVFSANSVETRLLYCSTHA